MKKLVLLGVVLGILFLGLGTARSGVAAANLLEPEAPVEPAVCSALAATDGTAFRSTLIATKDSYVSSASPNTNYGANTGVQVGNVTFPSAAIYHTLLAFDLSSLPADAVILTATLELSQTNTYFAGILINTQALTSTWAEGTVTWNNQPGFTLTDEATESPYSGDWRRWNITSIAQKWHAGTLTNYGVRLVYVSGASFVQAFSSSEGANPPRLVVEYVRQTPVLYVQADTDVSQASPSTPGGSSSPLYISRSATPPNYETHALLSFDVSSVPAGSTIISASLGLHPYFALAQAPTAPQALDVVPEAILATWNEATVTWNTAPASASQGDPTLTWSDATWNWFDVTNIVRAWNSGTLNNYGIKLKPAAGFTGSAPFEAIPSTYRARLIITYGPPPCYPVTSVNIGGATQGVTDTQYTFTANILPVTATLPITYTWQADGQSAVSGQQSAVTYTWATTGTKTITVTVSNCESSVVDTHQIVINAPTPACEFPLTGLTLGGPATGYVETEYAYTATPIPANATPPLTYTWQADGQADYTGALATRNYTWATPGTKAITVTAQNCGGTVVQHYTVNVQPRPDLTISGAWYNLVEERVYYILQNVGGGTAPAGHTAQLSRDGSPVATALFNEALAPGAVRADSIPYAWTCAGATAQMRVCADFTGILPEDDEANNCFQQTWSCDLVPPQITSGPTVSGIEEHVAVVTWTTSEPCRSRVEYGRNGPFNVSVVSDNTLKTTHQATLSGLESGSLYWFNVAVTDDAGNLNTSGGRFFETLPPGSNPPQIAAIGMVEYPSSMYEFYVLQATLTETLYVDRVSFFLDGQLIGRDYAPDGKVYEVYFSPAARGLTRQQWYGQGHALQVQAYNLEGDVTPATATVTPAPRKMTAQVFMQKIAPSNTVYIGGDTAPAGTNITATVWAAEYQWGCFGEWIETPPPGLEAVDCSNVRQDVQQIALFLDGAPAGTYNPPTGVLTRDFVVDLAGKGVGTHTLKVRATSSDGVVVEREKTITILSGVMCVDVTRQVTWIANYYRVDLTLKNTCNTQIILKGLDDRGMVGFYPAAGEADASYLLSETTYDAITQRARAGLTINNVALAPGAQHTVRYVAVPVLRDQEFSGNDLGYSIGYESSGIVRYTVGTDPTVVDGIFYKPWTDSVAAALKQADYIIVTNPKRLNLFYGAQAADINRLYAAMAQLAYRKRGVLGFVDAIEFQPLDTLLATTWANQLHPDFKSGAPGGYVLLVGESEIIPAWYEDSFNVQWADGGTTKSVAYSDLPYASIVGKDKHPELAVGRIVGNSPTALLKPIETSIAVAEGRSGYRFDRSNALIVSGRGIGVESDFIPTVNIIDGVLSGQGTDVTKIHWKYNNTPSYTYVFTDATPNQDIVYFFGHGNVGSWGPGLSTGLTGVWPLNFNGSNPFVYGTTCLSGGYEPDAESMPEYFFDSGAGAYIGATEVSANGSNASAGKWFFRNWSRTETTGKVLTNLKQTFVSDSAYWRLWAYEYNFYGDPKYGALPPTFNAQSVAPLAAPASTLDVHIPDFEVTNMDGWDYAEIPNGRLIAEPDHYQTPYWTVALDYPVGVRAQAVTLTYRSAPTVTTGLNLTVTQVITSEPQSIVPVVAPPDGWYPPLDQQYSWRVEDNGDGTSKLIVTVYPFYYDSAAHNVVFYQDYTFDIETVTATTQIEALTLNETAYRPGQTAAFELLIGNTGEPQDVIVAAEVRSVVSDTTVAGFPLRSLKSLTDTISLAFEWDTTGVTPGRYEVWVGLYTGDGVLLDSDARDFRVGVISAELTALMATPETFEQAGQPIALSLVVSNTGSTPLNGTAYFIIQDAGGAEVATLSQPVTALAAGIALQIDKVWNPPAVASYRIIGFVAYNSATTDVREVTVSSTKRIYLPLVLRSSN
ncbi:MAG: DNRLRE domain-containing protein [Anaerolineae bacterium]